MARQSSILDARIIELGHEPILLRKGWQLCEHCGVQWHKAHRARIIGLGPCSREYPWSQLPPSYMAPWLAPPATTIVFHGRCLHPSHRLVFYRGVVYCSHCGYYTSGGRVDKLADPCIIEGPPHHKRILKRMQQGIYPLKHRDWPLPDDAQTPSGLLPFLSEEQAGARYPQATRLPGRRPPYQG